MKSHMKDRHEPHICEPDDEEHEEGNGRIILVCKSIQDDEEEVGAHDQFKQRHHTRPAEVFLGRPPICLTFDVIFGRSLETGLDAENRLHNGFRVTDR